MDKIFAITMLKHQFRNINLVSVGPHNAIYLLLAHDLQENPFRPVTHNACVASAEIY